MIDDEIVQVVLCAEQTLEDWLFEHTTRNDNDEEL